MYINPGSYADGVSAPQAANTPAQAGSAPELAPAGDAASVDYAGTSNAQTSDGTTMVRLSSRSGTEAAGAMTGSLQQGYQDLASAEAAQKKVVQKLADIEQAVRQAASTDDSAVREQLRREVSASLAQINQAAGTIATEDSGAGNEAEQAQESEIVGEISRQQSAAQAAVYLITSDSGSRTVWIGGDNSQMTHAKSLLGDFGMEMRSLGGEVYFKPSASSALVQQELSPATDPSAAQALSQSGISGRITINGRPYNLANLSGLSPMEVASLASVAAESGDLQSAVKEVSDGKNADEVAQDKAQGEDLVSSGSLNLPAASDRGAAAAGEDVGSPGGSGSESPSATGSAQGVADLSQLVAEGSSQNLVSDPQAALGLVQSVRKQEDERYAGLQDQLQAYARSADASINQVLQNLSGGGMLATAQEADETTGQVVQQIRQKGNVTALSPQDPQRSFYTQLLSATG